jgi:filamentous hemagglutinin
MAGLPMSEQVQENLKVTDQGAEKSVQTTPETAKQDAVIGGQPHQEVHGRAFARAHQNDQTLSEPDMIAMEEGETVAEHKERVARIQANRCSYYDSAEGSNGSAAETGTVVDYQHKKIGDNFYAVGMDYEEGRDSRSIYEKLSDLGKSAASTATDPEGQKAYIQGQLDKIIGIGEGLNIAKDGTKAAVVAGLTALTDGTVASFLSKPNAINDPLFHAVGGALDAMVHDPNALNHALEKVGSIVMSASEHYTAAPNKEKGHVIGETMFAMVNPEGSAEAGEAPLKVAIKVATKVDAVVWDTIGQTVKSIKDMTPGVAKQSKQMLYDYIESKGLTASQLERGGQIPKGFFENLEKPPEGTKLVGKGGDWPVLNERPSPDVVRQASDDSCVAAVGEMLSRGALRQADLYNEMVTIPEKLADVLGLGWKGGLIPERNIEKAFDIFARSEMPWGAELRDEFYHRVGMGHMVVVDGMDEAGNVMIRDPQHGTRYEMTRETFMKHWSHRAVFGTKPG